MAMNLGSKLIHQQICAGRFASARRFVAGRGGDMGSSTGLARASQTVRSYLTSNDGFFSSGTGRLSCALTLGAFFLGQYWKHQVKKRESVGNMLEESDKALRKAIEEKGVTRGLCEAKIAELKQKTESLSASEHERFVLQIFEGWLQVLTKDK